MVGPGSPIGIFDSGLGGLTVARAVIDALPHESVVYYGDTARYPYGDKPLAEVYQFALEDVDFLTRHGVKLIVAGCNSASAALNQLGRPKLDIPIIGVIDPPARTAVRLTRNKRIGVIGTLATIASGQYEEAIERTQHESAVFGIACPLFVEFVEKGITTGDDLLSAAHEYLDPLREHGVDTVILGCTHYPLLAAAIAYVMGPDVLLVSSAEEAAKDVYTVLTANNVLASVQGQAAHQFFTSGNPDQFAALGQRFLGPELVTVKPA